MPSRPPERRRMRRTVLPRGRCGGSGQRAALDRRRPTRPWRFRAASPMASAADGRRCTARAGSALSAAVNVTYTAAGGGLVAWLNDQTARDAYSTVHVTLPSGNVARGNAPLRLPSGLNLILQGQGMAGASNTTLDLERKNLDVGGMLGDGGRIEFRNMHVRNVRPSLASAAAHVLMMTPRLVCAGVCGAPASARRRRMRAPAVLCCAPIGGGCCVSCTVTTPVPPVTAEHCIVVCGRLRGCTSCGLRRMAASGIVVHACMLHRRAFHVASAIVGVLHRRVLHVASAQPARSARSSSPLCSVCCVCADRLGEGRASAAAKRRRDALVRRPGAACSPWPRAPRCSTPWRYPAPKHRCVQVGPDARWGECAVGGLSADGVRGRLKWAWLRRLVRRSAAWCAWRMAPSRSRAARSQTARRCVQPAQVARPASWYGMLRGAARPMDGAHGAAHACCGEWCTAYGARPEWRV
jgi:hypothetical protein